MTTDVTIFDQPQPLPAYLKTNPLAQALAEQIDGGLAGRQINRISLRNGKFRFMKGGVEIGSATGALEVVVISANPTVGRLWWEKAFDADDAGTRPDCYSKDGVRPEADSSKVQSTHCATCPQNAVGSAKNGKGKACSYKKRLVIVSPGKIDGDVYAMDAGAMSMFGDEDKSARKFNLKSYIEALKSNGLIVPAVVTKLTFDDNATVPKLHFAPVRVLTEQEFNMVTERSKTDEVRAMLDDVDRKSEVGQPVNAPAPVAVAAPAPPPPPPPAAAFPTASAPAAAPAASRGRGRPAKAETAPATAATPSGFPPANGGAAAPAVVPAAAPAPPPTTAAAGGGFTVDLDQFDA